MTNKPIIELGEWESKTIKQKLTIQDQKLVSQISGEAGRVDIDELRSGIRIRARSWVGLIQFETFSIRIVPKLAGAYEGLVGMLAYTNGLEALRRNQGERSLSTFKEYSLFELLALLLVESCERIVHRGLMHDYVEVEDDLPVLRGRLKVAEQVRQHYGQLDRLACRYDDHLSDIRENQLLLAALNFCRLRCSHPQLSTRIHRLCTVLSSACSVEGMSVETLVQPFKYNRLNRYYANGHKLAMLILQQAGIDDLLKLGKTRSFAFLLDMNRLFEAYVGKLLTQLLPAPYSVHTQYSSNSVIRNETLQKSYTSIRPDIIVKDKNQPVLVADTKYKAYLGNIPTNDIYQSFTYAYAFQAKEAIPQSLLFYPMSTGTREPQTLSIRNHFNEIGAYVTAIPIDIPGLLKLSSLDIDAKPLEHLKQAIPVLV